MNFKTFSMYFYDIKNRHINLHAIVLLLLMIGHLSQAATTYVTFNNGNLLVFPDSSVIRTESNDEYFSIFIQDNTIYRYKLNTIQSISNTFPKEMPSITSFIVDKDINHQVITSAEGSINDEFIDISVLGIGKWLTPSFTLSNEDAIVTVDAVEQHSDVSRLSFAYDRQYIVGYYGDLVLKRQDDGQYSMQPYGKQYTIHVNFLTDNNTRVPRIDINTVNGENISSRDYYLDAEIIIDGAGIFPSMTDSVQVKGRGHNSWSNNPNAKNPYRLKFNKKVKPLGLTKGKSWVLIANKMNASMLTNAIGMKAASIIGTPAANHIIPVDLYVNGTYKGSYNFTEKIGFSNNSIDLDDETASTLLEMDINYDEIQGQKFKDSQSGLLVNVHEPDFSDTTSTILNLKMVKSRFAEFTDAVLKEGDVANHVDVDYMARFLMLNDFICNYEIFHPKSCWCYNENILEDSCKFIFGPVWDFDWAFGYQTNRNYYKCDPTIDYYKAVSMAQVDFFTEIRYTPQIARKLYEHWRCFINNGIDELCNFCTEYYEFAKPSLLANRTYIGDNTDYSAQAERAASWLKQRAISLYEKIKHEVVPPGDLNDNGSVDINDVTLLIDYLLNGHAYIDTDIADITEDGNVTIDDLSALIDKLLAGA